MELWLALLTMIIADIKHLSMLDIFRDKHEALLVAGQLKANQKMRLLHDILKGESWSGPTRLQKWLRAINRHNSYFIVKYVHLGKN